MTDVSKEVQQVLSSTPDKIDFEQIAGEDASPLNAPVIEKDIAGSKPTEGMGEPDQAESTDEDLTDAPEQEINENDLDTDEFVEEDAFELPTAHAKQAADAFLGMADNFIEIGGGFFVKVKKHADFYDFDEVVQVIDQHNDKNVKRLRLEKEDKALLKPLLVEVLKKKAQKLTPEQQLIGALVSILVKKAQIVLEIRAENEVLLNRIVDIIREERGDGSQGHEEAPEEVAESMESVEELVIPEYDVTEAEGPYPESVLEVAAEEENMKGNNG